MACTSRAKRKVKGKAQRKTKRRKRTKKEKKEIYAFTRRLYYLLRHHNDRIQFQKLYGGVLGYYYPDADEIVIDHRRDIISVLIHEVLHKWHPNWSETSVGQKEKWVVNRLTPRQIKNIIKIMGNNL